MDKKSVVILFGGGSAEHEVSVISGLQVVENIDTSKFTPHAVRLLKNGKLEYYQGLQKRSDYLRIKPREIFFAMDSKGAYFQVQGAFRKKNYIDAAYLAFHGGNGESGQIQGFCEILGLPYTSPGVEASSISMNKALTKEVLEQNGIKTVPYRRVFSEEIKADVDRIVRALIASLKLPVIVKPVHLGSSIGISVAKTETELKKALLESSHLDDEVIVEKLIKNFTEYNVSVRRINGGIETSEIERPISKDEILSFADKYQRGGKKTGGMASLSRELPAKLPVRLKNQINQLASEVFKVTRAKGMVRIDFMAAGNNLFVTEINPIPGSMSYYLWEASGISFQKQITDLLHQAMLDHEDVTRKKLDYNSDIVEKFILSSKDR